MTSPDDREEVEYGIRYFDGVVQWEGTPGRLKANFGGLNQRIFSSDGREGLLKEHASKAKALGVDPDSIPITFVTRTKRITYSETVPMDLNIDLGW